MDPDLERLTALLDSLARSVGRHAELLAAQREVIRLDDVDALRKQLAALSDQLQEAQQALDEQLAKAQATVHDLARRATPSEPVDPEEMARQFRSVVESLQGDRSTPGSPVGTALRSLDVEIKAMIVVEGGTARLSTPRVEQSLDPNLLSTVRMSFGAVPVIPRTNE